MAWTPEAAVWGARGERAAAPRGLLAPRRLWRESGLKHSTPGEGLGAAQR